MRDNHQGGSLAGYIVIAVVLAIALIGGLYGLQRYNASRDQGTNDEVARDDERRTPAPESEQDEQERSDPSPETEERTESDDDDARPERPATDSEVEEEVLPETGPAETFAAAVALTALTFAGSSYYRSRHWTSRRD